MKAKKLIGSLVLGAMLATTPMTAFAETLTMTLGNRMATLDGKTIIMENAGGVTEDGMIMVPVRAVAEAFGGTVFYDKEVNAVFLTFPNGQWAILAVQPQGADAEADNDEIVSVAKFIGDRIYIPADIMALCLGGMVSYVDYNSDHVWRLVFHVR